MARVVRHVGSAANGGPVIDQGRSDHSRVRSSRRAARVARRDGLDAACAAPEGVDVSGPVIRTVGIFVVARVRRFAHARVGDGT
jgi:hypothetical protein